MRRLFHLIAALMVATAISGCAVRTSSGMYFFVQRGVVLQLVHTCTDRARVYQAGRGLVEEIDGATPIDVALEPVVPGERTIGVTVQSINSLDKVAATFTELFYIDSNSTTTQTWNIGSGGGWGSGKQSQCPTR